MSSSGTATAAPPLARMISSTLKWPTPPGTLRPTQSVSPPGAAVVSAAPDCHASTSGGVTSDCTQTMRGRAAPITPRASSSSHAFHMPSTPVPPPVG